MTARGASHGSRSSRPTIRMVAAEAGVSTATVSYVLNGQDLVDSKKAVAPATREHVLKVIADLGYSPNQSARGMSRGMTDQICLITQHLDSPRTQAVVAAIQQTGERLGKTCMLLLSDDWFDFLSRQGADAAVMDAGDMTAADLPRLRQLASRGTHLILMNAPFEPDGFDVIRYRVRRALDQAMKELRQRHTRIGLLRISGVHQQEVERAYLAGHAGLTIDPSLTQDIDASRERAYWAALTLLERPDRPTAILASNDLSAISALRAAHRLKLDVPHDLEIIGFGNSPEGQRTDPPLSTVGAEAPSEQIAALLTSRLLGEPLPRERLHVQEFSLHLRGTTR